MKRPCVYILANEVGGTLCTGVTSNLSKRIWEHKTDAVDGFTKQYGVHMLVYVEFHDTMIEAIAHEKKLKRWRRAWKLELIEKTNPKWRDLYGSIAK